MKIQEVCQKTNYTKRTIHFYIYEGLLSPVLDKPNGHYKFSEKDCERLLLIRILRNAGLSIPSIRSLLNNPDTTGLFLNQRIKSIQKEQKYLKQLSYSLNYIMENLPFNPQFNDIFDLCKNADIPSLVSQNTDMEYDDYDNREVNRFLWGVFLPDTPLTEYQEFLWKKLNKMTSSPDNEDGRKLDCFFKSLTSDDVNRFFRKQASHIKYIAELDDCRAYAEEMKHRISVFVNNRKDIDDWKKYYELLIKPQIRIYDSEIGNIALEMSPLFVRYYSNIHTSCELVYEWLRTNKGNQLLKNIQKNLEGYINLESYHHGELEVMANLRQIMVGENW